MISLLLLLCLKSISTLAPQEQSKCYTICTDLEQQHNPGDIVRCADDLFHEGVKAYNNRDFYKAEKLSSCSQKLQPDQSTLWNLLSSRMQLAIIRRNWHSLQQHCDDALALSSGISTKSDRGNVHYLVGSSFSKAGEQKFLHKALYHLEQASLIFPERSNVLHSLATFHHQYNVTFDRSRFQSAQRAAIRQSLLCRQSKSIIIVRPEHFFMDQSISVVETGGKIFATHQNVIVYGESVTIQRRGSCKFILPTEAFSVLGAISAKSPTLLGHDSEKGNIYATHLHKDVGFALPFGWRNFYVGIADALPRAWSLRGVDRIMVPGTSNELLHQLLKRLLVGTGSVILPYDPKVSYYIDVLHTVDWTDANDNGILGFGVDMPPSSVMQEVHRSMMFAGLLPIETLKVDSTDKKKQWTLVYIDRATKNGRVLTPRLTISELLNMVASPTSSEVNESSWVVRLHGEHKMTLKSTVELFQCADVILGMHGAGLSNLLFAKKGTVLVELTPKDRRFYVNSSTYSHYVDLAKSLHIEHVAVGTWETIQFASDVIERTFRFDQVLSNVLRYVTNVVVVAAVDSVNSVDSAGSVDSTARITKLATEASEKGTHYHREGDLPSAIIMYDLARWIYSSLDHPSCLAMNAAIRNTASIMYDKGFVILAMHELESLGTELGRDGEYALALMHRQHRYNQLLLEEDAENVTVIEAQNVPFFEYGAITYTEFIGKWWSQGVPVVFKNASQYLLGKNGLSRQDLLKSKCREQIVEELHYCENSTTWANLEVLGRTTLFDFLTRKKQENSYPGYVVDFSIGRLCPSLLEDVAFKMPRYVQDVLQSIGRQFRADDKNRLEHGKQDDVLSKFVDHWPSLFMGPSGTRSGLHVDSIGHFWQMVVSGKKKWTIFHPNIHHRLMPDALRRTFLLKTDEQQSKIPRWEVELNPGDLIMVPSRAAHQVLNVEGGIALAGNFVDAQSLKDVMIELQLGNGIAPGYAALLGEFEKRMMLVPHVHGEEKTTRGDDDGGDQNGNKGEDRDLSWKQFKGIESE